MAPTRTTITRREEQESVARTLPADVLRQVWREKDAADRTHNPLRWKHGQEVTQRGTVVGPRAVHTGGENRHFWGARAKLRLDGGPWAGRTIHLHHHRERDLLRLRGATVEIVATVIKDGESSDPSLSIRTITVLSSAARRNCNPAVGDA